MELHGFTERRFAELVRDARRSPRLLIGDSPFRGSIRGPEDVAAAWPELTAAEREVFGVLVLNARHVATRRVIVSIGTLNASLVSPREVFRIAVLYSAASLVLVHNHPSGDPEPSDEDLALTRRLANGGELLGIEVLDHVVIGSQGIVSLRARGLM